MSSRDKTRMGLKMIYTQLYGYYIKISNDSRYDDDYQNDYM